MTAFLLCARQGALLESDPEGGSLLQARSRELLADGKGVHREVESEGSRYGKALA